MRERVIEKHLTTQVKKLGGWAIKIISPGLSGIPDRLVLYNGRAIFIELKNEKGRCSPIQLWVHKQLLKIGFRVHVLYSKEDVDNFIITEL